MRGGTQSNPPERSRTSLSEKWQQFAEQWRHCSLLMAAGFSVIWRIAAAAMPHLQNTREVSGFHPSDVLLLMRVLGLMWFAPLVAAVLYGTSFVFRGLNRPEAVAGAALCSSALLGLIVLLALSHFTYWH